MSELAYINDQIEATRLAKIAYDEAKCKLDTLSDQCGYFSDDPEVYKQIQMTPDIFILLTKLSDEKEISAYLRNFTNDTFGIYDNMYCDICFTSFFKVYVHSFDTHSGTIMDYYYDDDKKCYMCHKYIHMNCVIKTKFHGNIYNVSDRSRTEHLFCCSESCFDMLKCLEKGMESEL